MLESGKDVNPQRVMERPLLKGEAAQSMGSNV